MSVSRKLTLEEIEEFKSMKSQKSNALMKKRDKSHVDPSRLELERQVREDVDKFILNQKNLIFNERDFQMQLAVSLMASGNYDDVDVEYYLPTRGTDILKGYEWDSNMRVDIVVRREEEFLPVELKYTTVRVVGKASRYGRTIDNMEILRNQGAQDIIRYNVWKDVRRIELLKKIFPAVKGGLVVFLTCDKTFLSEPRLDSACKPFSTAEKEEPTGGGIMRWNGNPTIADKYPEFTLEGTYRIKWTSHSIENINFYYSIIKV